MIHKVKSKDIAARMGLSATLVSLVLNNKADQHGISKETQERVIAVATRMGYFESDEVNVIEEKPGIIGMVLTSGNDPFISMITPYLREAFNGIGMGFSLFYRDPDDMRFSRLLKSMKKICSGLILYGDVTDNETARSLHNDDYPFILLEKSYSGLKLNYVSSDNNAGAIIITDHLVSLGYKKILIISDEEGSYNDREILASLKSAMKASMKFTDIQYTAVKTPSTGDSFDFSLIDGFLRPPCSTECIISVNAGIVIPLINSLQAHNVRIPQQIALVSMGDHYAFDLVETPVTRLRMPVSDMALKTAGILWTEVKNKGKSKSRRQILMKPELVIRDSCGSYLKKV